MINVEGQIWNIAAVADYLIIVYSNDHIMKNIQKKNVGSPQFGELSQASNNSLHHVNQNRKLIARGKFEYQIDKNTLEN